MRYRLAGPAAALAALLLAGCRDEPTGPKAGVLTLNLTTSATDEGAIVVTVSGPGEMGTVEAADPSYVVHSRSAGSSLRIAVFGKLATGPLVRFAVPDVRDVRSYSALVVEVADTTNALRAVGGPTLSIVQ